MKLMIPVSGIYNLWKLWQRRKLERRPVDEAWKELREINAESDRIKEIIEESMRK